MNKQPLHPLLNGNQAEPIEWDVNNTDDYRATHQKDLEVERDKMKEDARNSKGRKPAKKGK